MSEPISLFSAAILILALSIAVVSLGGAAIWAMYHKILMRHVEWRSRFEKSRSFPSGRGDALFDDDQEAHEILSKSGMGLSDREINDVLEMRISSIMTSRSDVATRARIIIMNALLNRAVEALPADLQERFEQEWRGHVADTPGGFAKLMVAAGFISAATRISRRHESPLVISYPMVATNFVDVDSADEADDLIKLGEQLAELLGYQVVDRGVLIEGSFFKEVKLAWNRAWSRREVQDKAKIIEDMLFGFGNIDIDNKIVEMTAKLVTALKDGASAAVIDSGAFLFIKVPDASGGSHVFCKGLTIRDRTILNNDPTIVGAPTEVLSRLQEAREISHERLEELENIVLGHPSPPHRLPGRRLQK
jgi:hypothetical protein